MICKKLLIQLYKKLLDLKENVMLDLRINNCERDCLEVKKLLISKKLFLRVYELKKKLRHLIHSDSKKGNVKRNLSACIVEKFSRYDIIRTLEENEQRIDFRPIDIVYETAKHFKQNNNGFLPLKYTLYIEQQIP